MGDPCCPQQTDDGQALGEHPLQGTQTCLSTGEPGDAPWAEQVLSEEGRQTGGGPQPLTEAPAAKRREGRGRHACTPASSREECLARGEGMHMEAKGGYWAAMQACCYVGTRCGWPRTGCLFPQGTVVHSPHSLGRCCRPGGAGPGAAAPRSHAPPAPAHKRAVTRSDAALQCSMFQPQRLSTLRTATVTVRMQVQLFVCDPCATLAEYGTLSTCGSPCDHRQHIQKELLSLCSHHTPRAITASVIINMRKQSPRTAAPPLSLSVVGRAPLATKGAPH